MNEQGWNSKQILTQQPLNKSKCTFAALTIKLL